MEHNNLMTTERIVRQINNEKWQAGLDVIYKSQGRINDIVVEQKYTYDDNGVIKNAWVFIILQLYDEGINKKYYKVTAKLSSMIAKKMYGRVHGFNIIDYLLRSRDCWKRIEEYKHRIV